MDGAGLDYIGNPAVPYSTMTWDDPNHSYRCWGNDGTSFNCRLTTTGNAMVGAAIAQALITAADGLGHLPVFLDLQLPAKLGAPAAIDFGSVPVGQPATMMITIFNAGDTARFSRSGVAGFDVLTYTLSASSGFGVPTGTFTDEAGGGGSNHTLTMSTATPGPLSGTLTIISNDPDHPSYTVVLSGVVTGAPCPCDWNHNGALGSQDFFDFLSDYFAGNADFNSDGTTNSQDFFDFVGCFFAGCP
jgi:hypothetical protein